MIDDQVQAALAQLQKRPDGAKSSMFEHFSDMVLSVMDNGSQDVDLAQISELVKKQALPAMDKDGLLPYRPQADTTRAKKALDLFGDKQPPIDPETGAPVEVQEPNAFESEDMLKTAQMFEAVGSGLGSTELYEVMLQVRRLGEDPDHNLKSVRFFGKMFGLFADYYVFEGVPNEPAPAEEESEEEKAKREAERRYPKEQNTGANACVFYACNTLGQNPLTRLPDVRPEHITAARTLKRLLTGNLDSSVSTYPPFPWSEAVFLRAQIARIAAATILTPAGWLTQEEGDGGEATLTPAEEFEPVALPDGDPEEWLANWAHKHPHLKRQGRCETKPIRELPEDTEEEVTLEADEQEEPPEAGQVLAPVSEDAKVGGKAPWAPIFSSCSKWAKEQTMGVRSVVWPGALAVTHGKVATNIYVGWGVKNAAYVPLPPPPIAEEYDQKQLESVDMPVKPDPDAEPPLDAEAEEEEA